MKRNEAPTIEKLVMHVWNDDDEAFSELYSITCDRLYNYCRLFMHSETKAMDAVRESYLLAYKNINLLKDPSLFERWLFRIAFQICYDKAITESYDQYASLLSPYELEVLPFHEKQIFFLHDYRDLSEGEIADALDISKKYVASALTSARKHLLAIKSGAV